MIALAPLILFPLHATHTGHCFSRVLHRASSLPDSSECLNAALQNGCNHGASLLESIPAQCFSDVHPQVQHVRWIAREPSGQCNGTSTPKIENNFARPWQHIFHRPLLTGLSAEIMSASCVKALCSLKSNIVVLFP